MWANCIVLLLFLIASVRGEMSCLWFYTDLGGHLTDVRFDPTTDVLRTSYQEGVAAAAVTIDLGNVTKECDDSLVYSLGNTVSKTSYESWLLNEEPALDAAAVLETKATLVRSGEIQFGFGPNRTVDQRLGRLLGANIRYEGKPVFEDYHIERITYARRSFTIAFIGLLSDLEEESIFLPRLSGYTLEPYDETVDRVVKELTELHSPDLIVILTNGDVWRRNLHPNVAAVVGASGSQIMGRYDTHFPLPGTRAKNLISMKLRWPSYARDLDDRPQLSHHEDGPIPTNLDADKAFETIAQRAPRDSEQIVTVVPSASLPDITMAQENHWAPLQFDREQDEWVFDGYPIPFRTPRSDNVKEFARRVWSAVEGKDVELARSDDFWGYEDRDYVLYALYADALLDAAAELGEPSARMAVGGGCLFTQPASLQHHHGVLTERMFRDTFYTGSRVVAVDMTGEDLQWHLMPHRNCPSLFAGFHYISFMGPSNGRLCWAESELDESFECNPIDLGETYRILINAKAYSSTTTLNGNNERYIDVPDYELVINYVKKQAALHNGTLPRPHERQYLRQNDLRESTSIAFGNYTFSNNELEIEININNAKTLRGPFSIRWWLDSLPNVTREELRVLSLPSNSLHTLNLSIPNPPANTSTFHVSMVSEQFGLDNLPFGGVSAELDLSSLFSDDGIREGVVERISLTALTLVGLLSIPLF